MSEKDNYIKALEDELSASLEREKKLSEETMSFRAFTAKKIKSTKLFQNVISDPDSKAGKLVRAPRSVYRLIKNPEVRKSLLQKKTVNNTPVDELSDNHFLDPWVVDSPLRLEIAEQALKDGRKLALYFVEKPDSSTFRYRCYNTFSATKNSQTWQAVYFFKNEVKIVAELLPKSSLLVFGRQSGQEKLVAKLTEQAHQHHIKVGLDIDDLVFDTKYLDIMLDTIGEKGNQSYWIAYFASVQTMAKQMDFFITTNEFLVEKLKGSFDKPCAVIRNSLNDEQISASLAYAAQKDQRSHQNFILGYFSGSPTHAKDFHVAEPELIEFLNRHDDAVLHVVGFMRFSKEARELVKADKIRFLPMVDFRKLQRLMSEVDVNIAPLIDNDFTNCKSELKFFEAAVVETTTIASPTYAFKNAIKDGKTGFLCQPGEWLDKLEYLYSHPAKNRQIALAAKEYCLKTYYGKTFLLEVEQAYDELSR